MIKRDVTNVLKTLTTRNKDTISAPMIKAKLPSSPEKKYSFLFHGLSEESLPDGTLNNVNQIQ